MNKFKSGDRVRFKKTSNIDLLNDRRIHTVYAVYSDTQVSLCDHEYKDVEADFLTDVEKLEPYGKHKQKKS